MNRNLARQRSDAAPPRKLSRDSAALHSCRLSKFAARFYWQVAAVQGLIHIVAELGWPTAYPAPGPIVTTTLYA
jgi:hypothetical protein